MMYDAPGGRWKEEYDTAKVAHRKMYCEVTP